MKNIRQISRLLTIFEDSFNGNIDFESMEESEFLDFVRDFVNGKTEYCEDEYYTKNYSEEVKEILSSISIRSRCPEVIACDLITRYQDYLIARYSRNLKKHYDTEMKKLSNDEFSEDYGYFFTDAENKLLDSLSNFWEEEIG